MSEQNSSGYVTGCRVEFQVVLVKILFLSSRSISLYRQDCYKCENKNKVFQGNYEKILLTMKRKILSFTNIEKSLKVPDYNLSSNIEVV